MCGCVLSAVFVRFLRNKDMPSHCLFFVSGGWTSSADFINECRQLFRKSFASVDSLGFSKFGSELDDSHRGFPVIIS
ncbi:hypothetical protein MTR67_007919 [Solanum verrucosum]|uniref:Uncharacterized protein n=1 Tax=Solanum verrucosum TaxID=315347 RepID=A0AAF0Q0H3_SOLVR|nr:hypothetical protein MTR67_007919 [Solanum verrucosum]